MALTSITLRSGGLSASVSVSTSLRWKMGLAGFWAMPLQLFHRELEVQRGKERHARVRKDIVDPSTELRFRFGEQLDDRLPLRDVNVAEESFRLATAEPSASTSHFCPQSSPRAELLG